MRGASIRRASGELRCFWNVPVHPCATKNAIRAASAHSLLTLLLCSATHIAVSVSKVSEVLQPLDSLKV